MSLLVKSLKNIHLRLGQDVVKRKKVDVASTCTFVLCPKKEGNIFFGSLMQCCQYSVSKISAAESPVDSLWSISSCHF